MKSVWTGLVEVVPCGTPSPLSNGAKGAFVNALAPAADSSEYKLKVEVALLQLKLKAVGFEEVEKFRDRSDRESVAEELYALAKSAEKAGAVTFGSFHNYFRGT
jgi:hypothetical protein